MGKSMGWGHVFIKDGKVVPEEEIYKGGAWTWSEGINFQVGLLKEKEKEAGLLGTKDNPPRPHRQGLRQDMRRAQNHSIHLTIFFYNWRNGKKGLMGLSHGPAHWLSTRLEHVGTKHFFTKAAASKGFCPYFEKVPRSTRATTPVIRRGKQMH